MKSVKADLHLHTNYSDGKLTPFQLIDLSIKSGLSIISITDHDNVNALEQAVEYGNQKGIQVIPGVEISADLDDQEVHILGYFIDYKNQKMLEFLSASRELRINRNEKIVRKLNEMGSNINFNDIRVKAGAKTSIGRPHIAMELNEEGFVNSYYDAFIKYIGDGKPAFVKKPNPKSAEVIKLVRDGLLMRLIQEGLDGIEIIHPSHSKEDIEYFSAMAAEHFLLTSGGSDYHGGVKNDGKNFGKFCITQEEIINMKRRLFS